MCGVTKLRLMFETQFFGFDYVLTVMAYFSSTLPLDPVTKPAAIAVLRRLLLPLLGLPC